MQKEAGGATDGKTIGKSQTQFRKGGLLPQGEATKMNSQETQNPHGDYARAGSIFIFVAFLTHLC